MWPFKKKEPQRIPFRTEVGPYAKYAACARCGWVAKPDSSATPGVCPECGSEELRYVIGRWTSERDVFQHWMVFGPLTRYVSFEVRA